MGRRRQWIYVREPAGYKPAEGEKAAITATCEQFIAEVLKPRFLPEIRPTPFNYPVDICGKWHGGKYCFMQRFRSDHPDAIEPEFDAPFAPLELRTQPGCGWSAKPVFSRRPWATRTNCGRCAF